MLRALPTLIFCDIKCLLSCYLWPKTPVGFTEGAGGTLGLQIKGLLLLIHSIPPHVTQAKLQRPQAENNSHTSYNVHLPLPLLAFWLSQMTLPPRPMEDGHTLFPWTEWPLRSQMRASTNWTYLTFCVGHHKQRKHLPDNGKSTIPTLLKVLTYPELHKGRESIYWCKPPLTPVPNLCPDFQNNPSPGTN